MLSNHPFQPHQRQPRHWFEQFQSAVQKWVRQEIIDEDPYDEEKLTAQALYEQFQTLERVNRIRS